MRVAAIRPWIQRYGSLALGLGMLLVINALWLVPVATNMRRSASRLALEIVDRVGTNIEFSVRRDLDALADAADELGITPDRYEFILKRLLSRYDGFQGVILYRPDGTEIFRSDRVRAPFSPRIRETVSGVDEHSIQAFELALKGKPSIGQVFVSDVLEPRTILTAPVRELGSIRGVLVGELNIRTLLSFVRDASFTSGGHLYVVDANGFQILHPDLAEFLQRPNFFSRSIVRTVVVDRHTATGLKEEDGYVNVSGVRVFAAGRPLSVGGWGLIVEQPRDVVLAGERQVSFLAFGIVVFGFCTIILFSRNQRFLARANVRLTELIAEIDNAGKMLVRRDLELTEANIQLREIDRIKSEFVSVAAHQLRTPLTGVKWTLHALLSDEFGPLSLTHKKTLGAVFQTANRLVVLVGDLLSVARLEEGRYGLRIEASSPEGLLRSIAERFESVAKKGGISYSFTFSPQPLGAFPHDPQSLTVILENLLTNAIEYTPDGGKVAVDIHESDTTLTLRVTDTGIGISRSEQIKMFTKFFRAPNAQKLQPNGTGLGLYLTKNIAERNRGTLTFESVEGEGSSFVVSLPRLSPTS